MDNEVGAIPKTLDAQERFLWWEIDQAILALTLTGMGVIAGAMLLGMGVGALIAWQYGKFKAGKHPRFAVHAMYWWLPSSLFVKPLTTPPSHKRHFLG